MTNSALFLLYRFGPVVTETPVMRCGIGSLLVCLSCRFLFMCVNLAVLLPSQFHADVLPSCPQMLAYPHDHSQDA
jgi:hypothetical protein